MAYNTGFPETYQSNIPQYSYNQPYYGTYQNYQNYQMPNQTQINSQTQTVQQQNNNVGIIWVQGEAGAKAYPVSPNSKVLLMDSENPVLYVKSVNASGIPEPLCIYDLVQRSENKVQVENVDDNRFKKIEDRLTKIENKIQNNNNNKQRGNRNDG